MCLHQHGIEVIYHSPDEIVGLAEKLVTVYQHDIEQRFSNDLLQFVDYSNDFLDYVEDAIDI